MSTLSSRQENFAREVAAGNSHRAAAVSAGYSERCASSIGSQLVSKPKVRARIAELREASPRPLVTGTELQHNEVVTVRDHAGRATGLFIPMAMLSSAVQLR